MGIIGVKKATAVARDGAVLTIMKSGVSISLVDAAQTILYYNIIYCTIMYSY